AAGFLDEKLGEVFQNVQQAAGLIHKHEIARAEGGPHPIAAFRIQGGVQKRSGDDVTGSTAGLDGVEPLAVGAAASHFLKELADGDAHWKLVNPGIGDITRKGKELGAWEALRTQA